MLSVFVRGEGGSRRRGGVGALLALANYFVALLARLHHNNHHWPYCSHCRHHRCFRLQGSVVRWSRVVPATTAVAPMIPVVLAGAYLDGGGV